MRIRYAGTDNHALWILPDGNDNPLNVIPCKSLPLEENTTYKLIKEDNGKTN